MMNKAQYIKEAQNKYTKALDKAQDLAGTLFSWYGLDVAHDWDSEHADIKDMDGSELDNVCCHLEDIINKLTAYREHISDLADAKDNFDSAEADYINDMSNSMGGYWYEENERHIWRDWDTDEIRAYIEWDKDSKSYMWVNAECEHGESGYEPEEIDEAMIKAMADWERYH
jgi:hypothetical protein